MKKENEQHINYDAIVAGDATNGQELWEIELSLSMENPYT